MLPRSRGGLNEFRTYDQRGLGDGSVCMNREYSFALLFSSTRLIEKFVMRQTLLNVVYLKLKRLEGANTTISF